MPASLCGLLPAQLAAVSATAQTPIKRQTGQTRGRASIAGGVPAVVIRAIRNSPGSMATALRLPGTQEARPLDTLS
ncbi:hypothetical protein MHA02_36900 [Methylobacterium haplocladii]|uniref:Uncharacterized protein n=1 Tax=Methylobacterium haplocladii TaxID=1176176 RepID=A0A512IUC3_9HYPH|nr:hypothetical protein MHA02_36900 [Methylobacterium haplocladii]